MSRVRRLLFFFSSSRCIIKNGREGGVTGQTYMQRPTFPAYDTSRQADSIIGQVSSHPRGFIAPSCDRRLCLQLGSFETNRTVRQHGGCYPDT